MLHAMTERAQRILSLTPSLLGVLFLWSALAKAYSPSDAIVFASTLMPGLNGRFVVVVASIVEWGIAIALFSRRSAKIGLVGGILLLVGFTLALLFAKVRGFEGSCGCMGFRSTLQQALA
jgi:hypothetical protein